MAYPPPNVFVNAGQPAYIPTQVVENYLPFLLQSLPDGALPPVGNCVPPSSQFQGEITEAVASSTGRMRARSSKSSAPRKIGRKAIPVPKEYVCQTCLPNVSFPQPGKYINHMVDIHPDQKTISCWIEGCNTLRYSPKASAAHYARDHVNSNTKPICIHCNQPFRDIGVLKQHMPKHFPEKKVELRRNVTGPINCFQVPCILVKVDDDGKKYYDCDPEAIGVIFRKENESEALN